MNSMCEARAPWRGHRRCQMDHEYEQVGTRVHGYRSSRRHGAWVTWAEA